MRRERKLNRHIINSPIVVITGAGASAPLNLRTTYSFRELIEGQQWFQPVAGGQNLYELLSSLDGTADIDVERVLDYMQEALNRYETLERDPEFLQFFSQMSGARVPEVFRDRRERIYDLMVDHYGRIPPGSAGDLYKPLIDTLRSVLVFYKKSRTLPLFTLNYDVAVEAATDEVPRLTRIDGVNTKLHDPAWDPDVYHSYAPSRSEFTLDVVLFKLHGSVSWVRRNGSDTIIRLPGVPRRTPGLQHVIQYPSAKYKNLKDDPFATSYRYLGECLGNAKLAFVIGCSFRDEELLDCIKTAHASNSSLALYSMNPLRPVHDNALARGLPLTSTILAGLGTADSVRILDAVLQRWVRDGKPWDQEVVDATMV